MLRPGASKLASQELCDCYAALGERQELGKVVYIRRVTEVQQRNR
jgi:hypothetical protein